MMLHPLRSILPLLAVTLLLARHAPAEDATSSEERIRVWLRDDDGEWNGVEVYPVSALEEMQPVPIRPPTTGFAPRSELPEATMQLRRRFFASSVPTSLLSDLEGRGIGGPRAGIDIAIGAEARTRATTDAGDLLGKSPSMLGIETQKRNPIVTDPRQRGSRVGSLAASGSYWVPARIDLDTMLSKIDSRIVESAVAVNGPYTVENGPGASFLIVDLMNSPRFDVFQNRGSTSMEYKFNGRQVYGRQTLWGGDRDWGYRLGYGHRTGNDYLAGNGADIPSSYNSRDFDVALGWDPSDTSLVEFSYLRLDQTNVELPGQAFDLDFLVTDGFDVEYVVTDHHLFDRLEYDVWYNRTRFLGSAQRPGKRRQFPFFDLIGFVGRTDVDSASLGQRLAGSWGDAADAELTVGTDLRHVRQELNEITSGRIGGLIWSEANSPIPKSDTLDPGVFARVTKLLSTWRLEAGVRADFVGANVLEDPDSLGPLGTSGAPYSDIVGTDRYERDFSLWAGYATAECDLGAGWTLLGSVGYSERAPNLTELYAAEPFMFLLQNGLNTVTGNPGLADERHLQIDTAIRWDFGRLRGGLGGYVAYVQDYITFENMGEFLGPPFGQIEQTNLRYVNTDVATFVGGAFHTEADLNCWCRPFATFRFVDGRDQDRNGDFASLASTGPGSPLTEFPGLPRGSFSLAPRSAREPLPGIPPMESRLGIRVLDPSPRLRWGVELSARVVNDQDRVAVSLNESPTPGFTVWDLRGYWNVTDDLSMTAGVENFTDRTYREHFDFRSENGIEMLQPGVNFYLGARRTY